ncbi:MAG: DNA gyrase inhibitor YacG [Cellvibrionaceae bacterium]|nr:DNA gyrase inhibitor YacG [Cellvibrionaceae bacterium]MCV6626498.1 DNA gyrase inhibitor YacG [Cellvibrionaceae bacterium]
MAKPIELACPNCKAKVLWNEDFPQRPFCSSRCKLIDLGEWASENHKIPGSPVYEDILSEDLNREH